MRSVSSLFVGALALVAVTAGCASSGSSATGIYTPYPGDSVPPTSPNPAPTSQYSSVPHACSMLNKATLQAIVPGSSGGSEDDEAGDGIIDHICNWHSSGTDWTRTITVTIERDSGNALENGRSRASDAYQTEISGDLPNSSQQEIHGLGNKAQLNVGSLKTGSSAQLHILSQNAVITIVYLGANAKGSAMTMAEMKNGTVSAADAVLAAIH